MKWDIICERTLTICEIICKLLHLKFHILFTFNLTGKYFRINGQLWKTFRTNKPFVTVTNWIYAFLALHCNVPTIKIITSSDLLTVTVESGLFFWLRHWWDIHSWEHWLMDFCKLDIQREKEFVKILYTWWEWNKFKVRMSTKA